MEIQKIYCPRCGNDNLQTIVKADIQTQGKNYSASQGCCGALLLGPFGLLCGLCGQGQKITSSDVSMFACNHCGHEFKKKEEIQRQMEAAEKAKYIVIPFSIILSIAMYFISVTLEPDPDMRLIFILLWLAECVISTLVMFFIFDHMEDRAYEELCEYQKEQKRRAEEAAARK